MQEGDEGTESRCQLPRTAPAVQNIKRSASFSPLRIEMGVIAQFDPWLISGVPSANVDDDSTCGVPSAYVDDASTSTDPVLQLILVNLLHWVLVEERE